MGNNERISEIAEDCDRLSHDELDAIWTAAEAYGENDSDPECERLARVLQGIWNRHRKTAERRL